MPGRDGTGPLGQGSSTGRGLGKCKAVDAAGAALGTAIGIGAAVGYGRRLHKHRMHTKSGFGRGFSMSLEDEKRMLEERLQEINELTKG